MKRALAFICVLTLVMSLCSLFTFAATPEVDEVDNGVAPAAYDAFFRVTKSGTYLYNRANSGSGYACPSPISVGTVIKVDLSYIPDDYYSARHTVGSSVYTGYVKQSNVARVN